jgi:hypothetical protein
MLQSVLFLSQSQLPDGEFQTEFCVPQESNTPAFDSSPFVTSLAIQSLEFARHVHPGVAGMIERGCRFLLSEMEPGGLWRYWSRKNARSAIIPPDLDDTACISHALKANGFSVPPNQYLFLDSRDAKGAFYTWLYKPDSYRKLLLWLRTRGRAFSHRREIWGWTRKEDVCAVVNANVLTYLGETPETSRALTYLKEVILQGRENQAIVFYAHKLSLYYALSRAYFCGVSALSDVKSTIVERIMELRLSDDSFGDELLTGMAICSLLNLGQVHTELGRSVEFLLSTQQPDGSWKRIPAYGGPPLPTTFGSADLTTAICLEALARYDAR